jgi:hypothetical protein
MRGHGRHRCALAALLVAVGFASPARAHLLITEVGYDTVDETSPTSEFVEILNPDPGGVPLANLWLVGDEDAYPYLVNGPVSGISLNNFIYRFPAITMAPGDIVVVCQDSDAFLAEFFPVGGLADFLAQPGHQTLVEVTQDGTVDGVPDMINWGSNPTGTLSMANNGECVGLVSWDGASDLVVDHDWVCWLTNTHSPNKDVDYPLGIDGPDANFDPTFFANDRANGLPAPDSPQGSSIHRTSLAEKDEVAAGGNGAGGHDETSEDWSVWQIGNYDPGLCPLTTVAVPTEDTASESELSLGIGGPHPFGREVRIRYVLPRPGRVRLKIHDLQGRAIATLVDGLESAGTRIVSWNGRDQSGGDVQSGVYFARLECDGGVRCQRLVRIRE